METDKILKIKAMGVLTTALGVIGTARFISMIKCDTFDYTEWQQKLWAKQSVDEIHDAATIYERNNCLYEYF